MTREEKTWQERWDEQGFKPKDGLSPYYDLKGYLDKELLLKDLSSRLPYDVKIAYHSWDSERGEHIVPMKLYSLNTDGYMRLLGNVDEGGGQVEITKYLPYLRPMSSMTEEERTKKNELFGSYILDNNPAYIDWLNAHHFDYRGLIEKGLALEAKEGMYERKR